MSGRDFDVSRQVEADVKRFKRLNKKGLGDIEPGAAIEYTLWTISVASAVGMVVVMPWVGPSQAIPGHVWLGFSLAGILVFGGLAVFMRWVRQTGDDIDREMNQRFDTTRGR